MSLLPLDFILFSHPISLVEKIKKSHFNLYFFFTLFSLPPVFNTKTVAYLLPGPLPPDPTFLLEERLFPRTRDSPPLGKELSTVVHLSSLLQNSLS